MRNRKLFILISLILISSLIFVGCGKNSKVEEKEIENEKIVVEEEKDIDEKNMNETEEVDVEEDNSTDTPETIDSEKDNEKQDSSQSSKTTSKEKTTKEVKESKKTKEESSDIAEKASPSVTIIIIGPEDVGTILDATEVELKDGDTVFDILKQVVKDNSIQMEYKGRKSSVYVQGIHNIYEFDKGPESGWVYRVNGEISQVSCGAHKLNDGDKIEWLYTTDLGREFGAPGGGK